MYVPPAFAEVNRAEIERLLTEYPMAQLVTMTDDGLVAPPLPLLYEPTSDGLGSLVGHVARANRQWSKSSSDVEALAIFTGPDAYIAPNWDPSTAEHGNVVPTWNYETVHVRGSFVAHDDPVGTRALVTRLTQFHESQLAAPWGVSDAPADYIDSMVKAIVGIEVQITSIQAKRKLSQNRPPADIAGTIAALQEVGGSSAVVADAMRRLGP